MSRDRRHSRDGRKTKTNDDGRSYVSQSRSQVGIRYSPSQCGITPPPPPPPMPPCRKCSLVRPGPPPPPPPPRRAPSVVSCATGTVVPTASSCSAAAKPRCESAQTLNSELDPENQQPFLTMSFATGKNDGQKTLILSIATSGGQSTIPVTLSIGQPPQNDDQSSSIEEEEEEYVPQSRRTSKTQEKRSEQPRRASASNGRKSRTKRSSTSKSRTTRSSDDSGKLKSSPMEDETNNTDTSSKRNSHGEKGYKKKNKATGASRARKNKIDNERDNAKIMSSESQESSKSLSEPDGPKASSESDI